MTHWFVSFVYEKNNNNEDGSGNGFGHATFETDKEYFPINEAVRKLMRDGNNDGIIILSFKQISEECCNGSLN